MKRMLVPVDFSEPSLYAVRYAIAWSDVEGAELVLLHVVEGAPHRSYAVNPLSEALLYDIDPTIALFRLQAPPQLVHRDLVEEAHWRLAALIPPGVRRRMRPLVVVGRAVDEIIRVAGEEKADVILIGINRRSRWRRLVRKGIAGKVSRKAPIPVITVEALSEGMRGDLSAEVVAAPPDGGGQLACVESVRGPSHPEGRSARRPSLAGTEPEPMAGGPLPAVSDRGDRLGSAGRGART